MRQVLLPLCDLVAPLVLNLHTKVRKANLSGNTPRISKHFCFLSFLKIEVIIENI